MVLALSAKWVFSKAFYDFLWKVEIWLNSVAKGFFCGLRQITQLGVGWQERCSIAVGAVLGWVSTSCGSLISGIEFTECSRIGYLLYVYAQTKDKTLIRRRNLKEPFISDTIFGALNKSIITLISFSRSIKQPSIIAPAASSRNFYPTQIFC